MLYQAVERTPILQEKENRTGIPLRMKEKCEAMSGLSFDNVRVHYSSAKPAGLGALAYTQGNHVYVGPGQERCLGHELGHVVQQKQGRVKPDTFFQGQAVNTDRSLEREADRLGGTIQCATSISYSGQNYAYYTFSEREDPDTGEAEYVPTGTGTETVGGTTTAHLDPKDSRKGTTPSGQDAMMGNLRVRYGLRGNQLVRGHLLNHDLGGLGIDVNMFPITAEANHLHSACVEQPIKSILYKGYEVDYQITAVNNNSGLGLGNETNCADDEFQIQVTVGGQPAQTATVYSNMYRENGSIAGRIDDNLDAVYDTKKITETKRAWHH